MQAVGMIAEFNPLHNGHVYALNQAKQQSGADVVVVVMSGNYVQRGAVAVIDKWQRTKAAIAAGADLVVELPTVDAVQAAPDFAVGAVTLLKALLVDQLAFGTENAQLDYQAVATQALTAAIPKSQFKQYNATYATQMNQWYQSQLGITLDQPNLLLGLSYAQANLTVPGPSMRLVPLLRLGPAHDTDSVAGNFASASYIRQQVAADNSVAAFVPPATVEGLRQPQMSWAQLYPWLRYRLQTASLSELAAIDGMAEGLEYRFSQQVDGAPDFEQFLAAVKSKRYTYSRLRRLALHVTLNMTQEVVASARAHRSLHVLGFSALGQAYLRQVKKQVGLPLVTKVNQEMLHRGLMAEQHRFDRLIETLTGTAQNYGRVPVMNERKNPIC